MVDGWIGGSADLLDMGVGGGEWLSARPRARGRTVATEAWAPNIEVARSRLAPLGISVVAVAGDSIVTEAGPFESALRKGVQVSVQNVTRLQDGKMVGTTIAHYATKGADSVRNLRFEGTRAR